MKLTNLNKLIEENQNLKGRWELSPNHEIRYKSLDLDEEIAFRGSLVSAEPDALVVSFTQSQKDQKVVRRLARLTGAWRLDSQNRIVFEAQKEGGKKDALTFKGAWEIGKNHEVIYTYGELDTRSGIKERHKLIFRGYWDISQDHRLTYFVGGSSYSFFRFRGTFQTKSIYAKDGEIRYQVGIELQGRKRLETIILFGKWKLSHKLDLSFEIEYEDGKKKAILFGGGYALTKDSQIIINLKSQEGDPLGIELILTKDFFGRDGQAFIRLQKSVKEERAETGVMLRW